MKTNHFNCIYMYVNKINEKKYIGQTNNFNRRKKELAQTIQDINLYCNFQKTEIL